MEKSLISQCAPTLASLKTGSLFSTSYGSINELEKDISIWNDHFTRKGITVCILKYANNTALIYVYRESALKKDLCQPATFHYLLNYGYNPKDVNATLCNLQIRLNAEDEFPHEIGLFLSYPLEDVTGFICNKGKNCSHCGYWKVYGDKSQCLKTFHRYDKCRDIYYKLWSNGRSVLQLTVAV